MKSVKNKLHEFIINSVDIDACTLYKVHNAFGFGVNVFIPSYEMLLIWLIIGF